MRAVILVLLAGIGLGALGPVAQEMYMVGAIVFFIGLIGLLTRLGELLPWVRSE